MNTAHEQFKFSPVTGTSMSPKDIFHDAYFYRTGDFHDRDWVFNPWTGKPRSLEDLTSDPQGYCLIAPGEALNMTATEVKKRREEFYAAQSHVAKNDDVYLNFDPESGAQRSATLGLMTAQRFRELSPRAVWVYNPWTGVRRNHDAIVEDLFGHKIIATTPGGEPTRTTLETVSIDSILADRGKRYGKFTDHASITQVLKNELYRRVYENTTKFEPDQLEAIDMICHKLGRIVNGDPNYADSWDDIAGYAKLVGNRLRGVAQ